MNARGDFLGFVRDEERRKREESKVQTLQAQIDEIRHLTRELASRQLRLEGQLKSDEADLAQHRLALEQHRHDVAQAAQARQVEESRVRQQLADLEKYIDDSTRPIRTLQAHVAELIEAVRRQRDDVGHDTKRYDELRTLIDYLSAHHERQVAVSQSLRESVDSVRTEIERLQRDQLRTDDAVKILEQEVRRRTAEVAQRIENMGAEVEEELSVIDSLKAQLDEVRELSQATGSQLETVREVQERFESDIARFYAQAVERDDHMVERLEEIRQQFEVRTNDLQKVSEESVERLSARAEQLDEVDREISYRINMFEMQLEELQQVEHRLRREIWYLEEQRVRRRLEQDQQELEGVLNERRDVDGSSTQKKSTNRRPG